MSTSLPNPSAEAVPIPIGVEAGDLHEGFRTYRELHGDRTFFAPTACPLRGIRLIRVAAGTDEDQGFLAIWWTSESSVDPAVANTAAIEPLPSRASKVLIELPAEDIAPNTTPRTEIAGPVGAAVVHLTAAGAAAWADFVAHPTSTLPVSLAAGTMAWTAAAVVDTAKAPGYELNVSALADEGSLTSPVDASLLEYTGVTSTAANTVFFWCLGVPSRLWDTIEFDCIPGNGSARFSGVLLNHKPFAVSPVSRSGDEDVTIQYSYTIHFGGPASWMPPVSRQGVVSAANGWGLMINAHNYVQEHWIALLATRRDRSIVPRTEYWCSAALTLWASTLGSRQVTLPLQDYGSVVVLVPSEQAVGPPTISVILSLGMNFSLIKIITNAQEKLAAIDPRHLLLVDSDARTVVLLE